MTKRFDRLYAHARNGKLKWWSIRVEKPATIVITHATGEDAKPIETRETIKSGKNLGRANETSPWEQACLEAQSRWLKKQDKGYTIGKPLEATVSTNALGLPRPMLATPLTSIKKPLPEYVYVQPKLDGHRCMAALKGGEIKLWSRGGKYITTLEHLHAPLKRIFDGRENMVLDGELYIHGMKLQDIGSLIKRQQPCTSDIEYAVFDVYFPTLPHLQFDERWERLDLYFRYIRCGVYQLPTHSVAATNLTVFCNDYRAQGYEGAIARLPDGLYEPGMRVPQVIKIKEFLDAEFEVRNVFRSDRDVVMLDCGGFDVTAPGTHAQKEKIFKSRKKYIGKLITVQFAHWTKDKKPAQPVALRFREDI